MRLRRLPLAEIARRRVDAARDADLLARGWRPTPAQLADAPHIDDWIDTVYPGRTYRRCTVALPGIPCSGLGRP